MGTEAVRVRVQIFVANRVELARIDAMSGPQPGWPSVDCTDWLDGMDRLAADITGQELTVFGDHELIFPEGDASEWDGPWLVRVPDDVVTALAETTDEQLGAYAAQPGRTVAEAARNSDLRELCQQALIEGRGIYQWSTA